METEILVPDQIAVMTLPGVTFFPQALLPLHIFEPRYRLMLKEALAAHRLFTVAKLADDPASAFEPAHRIATMGIVRACQENENGTSNLLLQGLVRVEMLDILREEPYRLARIRALSSDNGADPEENVRLRSNLSRLLHLKQRLQGQAIGDFGRFLKTVEDPEAFVDIAAFNLCEDPSLKQTLLETLDVRQRLRLFAQSLRRDIDRIKLDKRLQGPLADEAIGNN